MSQAMGLRFALVLILLYGAFRVLLVPSNASTVAGFTHDGAYISLVADEVREGHGLVNPASWLLFLKPAKLPMPYHNANPGFPLAVSGLGLLLHCDSVRASLLISAFSSALLFAAVFFLVHNYEPDWRPAFLVALLVTIFPANIADSLSTLPDALCTSLAVWAIAAITWKQSYKTAIAAGALLGAAWLTRSSVLILWPAVGYFIFRIAPEKRFRLLASSLIAFVVVISPWLVYTYHVWGSPLRSDASYYLLQDFNDLRFGGSVDKFYRSLDTPESLGQILKHEPQQFAKFYLSQLRRLPYQLLAQITDWRKILLAPLFALIMAALLSVQRVWRKPEFLAGLAPFVLLLLLLATRAQTFELRYLGASLVVALIFAFSPVANLFRSSSTPSRVIACVVLLSGLLLASESVQLYSRLAHDYQDNVRRRAEDLAVTREFPGPIVTIFPYYFSYYTGRSALSPPVCDKETLLRFMDKYSARYLALPTQSLDYYYKVSDFEPQIHAVKQVGTLTVFEREL